MTPKSAAQSVLSPAYKLPSLVGRRPPTSALSVRLRQMKHHGPSKVSLKGISLSYQTNDGKCLLVLCPRNT